MRTNAGSVSQYAFNLVPSTDIPRSRLFRPSTHKTAINAGLLYPLYFDEVLPGDTFKVDVSCLARLTTLLTPVMDNLFLDWQFFFVPYRLVWDNWQKMCGEQENPGDSIDYTVPYVSAPDGGITTGSIYDYFGLPINVKWKAHDVMSLPFRAYNLIWNEWFRNENIQNSVTVPKTDGPDLSTAFTLLPRNKRKDYFTAALPSPQKGSPLTIPVGSTAAVVGDGTPIVWTDGTNPVYMKSNVTGTPSLMSTAASGSIGDTATGSIPSASQNKILGAPTTGKTGYVCDLTSATAVTINELREAFQLQRFLERCNLGGTRYREILEAHFQVRSPDARLQRPEFLGSFSVAVNVHAITQNSASLEGGTPQGNLSGVGVANGVHRAFSKSFVEHGMIIGLASIRSEQTYQQGIHRMWSRSSRFGFYWPTLAHLGEQAILNKELYAQGGSVVDDNGDVVDDKVYGYQERWSEYKYGRNMITGKLRSTASGSLDVWHLAQNFGSLPTLNNDFIVENPPLDRVLAINDEPQFIIDTLFSVTSVRPMPVYDTPGFIDHF